MLMRELVVHWHVDPAILHIGGFELRWYSILFVSGFILGWFIFKWFFQREKIDTKLLDPLLYTLLICTIVGARLGHCLFYQPDYYLGSWQGFWEIFMPWKGGLASHGGTIALILGMWWFANHYGKKHDFDFVWLLDHLAIAVAFAGAFIRFGNLFNSEIYGNVTDLPWASSSSSAARRNPSIRRSCTRVSPTSCWDSSSSACTGRSWTRCSAGSSSAFSSSCASAAASSSSSSRNRRWSSSER